MLAGISLDALARKLETSRGFAAKNAIAAVTSRLGVNAGAIAVGDDCAAIPDGDGFLLFAIEGFMNEFVAGDPWFAGWCGVMVNLSDIAAMGGRPIAVVDALWADGEAGAEPVLAGLADAAARFSVPIIGGHSNLAADRGQLAVAVLGRARRLLTSFDADAGDRILLATDLRGRYREPFNNFEAATDAPAARLAGDLALLPEIAEAGLSRAAKDVSQAGIIGTLAMLCEGSGVGAAVDLDAIPLPAGVALERWLQTFPSYGYLIAVKPGDVAATAARFTERGIAAADIGAFTADRKVAIGRAGASETVWDLGLRPFIGCAPGGA